MATLTVQVGASSDDAYRRLTPSAWDLATGSSFVGAADTSSQMGFGMRFLNITIPQGASITQAYLTLQCKTATSGTTVNARISAEDVDNAITFADDAAAFDTRWAARTTARVDWDNIAAWVVDTNYDSPEIKTVIQEIVDRALWASGNAIVIFLEDYDDRSTHAAGCYRDARSYDSSTTYAPKLVIEYSGPTGFSYTSGFWI